MSCKKINIKDMMINHLYSQQAYDWEYETKCNIDFLLQDEDVCEFNVLGEIYKIDRIKMTDWFGDEVHLTLADGKNTFDDLIVPKNFINAVYRKILENQKQNGELERWSFEDDLLDALQQKDKYCPGKW